MQAMVGAVLVVMACALPAGAQETRARITGSALDATGNVIPGVTITAVNTETNVATEAVANSRGVFTLQQLVPGRYKVTAAMQGFKTFIREGIELHTAETVNLDVQLALGGIEETITVIAQASQIESNESTVSQTIENKRISELPLNGRQVYMLMQLTPGTIFTQTTFGATGFSGTRAWDVNGSLSVPEPDQQQRYWSTARRAREPAAEPGAGIMRRMPSKSSRSACRASMRRTAARAAA